MIDIGLSKMALIGAVALIVIGPEKLPRVARTVGTLLGKAQRYVADVKAEVNRSMELDELKKMKDTVESAAREVHDSIQTSASAFEKDWAEAIDSAAPLPSPTPTPPPCRARRRRCPRPSTNTRASAGASSAARCPSGTRPGAACAAKPCPARPVWRATGPENPADTASGALPGPTDHTDGPNAHEHPTCPKPPPRKTNSPAPNSPSCSTWWNCATGCSKPLPPLASRWSSCFSFRGPARCTTFWPRRWWRTCPRGPP